MPRFALLLLAGGSKKKPLAVQNRQGCERMLWKNTDYRLSKLFHAFNRLLTFTEPRPLAKLQPACAA